MHARFLVLAFAVILLAPAGASHCATWTTSAPEVDFTSHGAGYYVDADFPCCDMFGSVWIYEESNDLAGLQRGDELRDDTCHDMIAADTIIF